MHAFNFIIYLFRFYWFKSFSLSFLLLLLHFIYLFIHCVFCLILFPSLIFLERKQSKESFSCNSHPSERLKLFCSSTSCMKPVCTLCTHDDTHKNHDFKLIAKAFDIYWYVNNILLFIFISIHFILFTFRCFFFVL